MPKPLSIDDMNDILVVIWDELSDCEPGKILERYYLEHPEDSPITDDTRNDNDTIRYVSKYLKKMGDALIGTMCPLIWDSTDASLPSQSHVIKDTTIVNRFGLSGMGSVMDDEDIIDRDNLVRSNNNVDDL